MADKKKLSEGKPAQAMNPTPWLVVTPVGGSREGVKTFVQAAMQKGIDGKIEGADQSFIEDYKTVIVKRIDALPVEFNHVVVRADGRVTPQGEVVSIRVTGSIAL